MILEQNYFLSKLNEQRLLYHGSGLIEGLQLLKKKGSKFVLKKGCGVDETGNIIQIEKDQLYDIKELQGFHKLQDNVGLLCLNYYEQDAKSQDGKLEYIEDGYRLSIQSVEDRLIIYEDFFETTLIYEDYNTKIKLFIPSILPTHGSIHSIMCITQKHPMKGDITYHLKSNRFIHDKDEIPIPFGKSEKLQEYVYIPLVANDKAGGKFATFDIEDIILQLDGKKHKIASPPQFRIKITDDLQNALKIQLHHYHFLPSKLQIGHIRFHTVEGEVMIDDLTQEPSSLSIRPFLMNKEQEILQQFGYKRKQQVELPQINETNQTTGVVTCHFEDNQTLYISDEIQHGLGAGTIWMDACIECNDIHQNYDHHEEQFFGDIRLFHEEQEALKLSIRCSKNDGNFQLGIKRLEECSETTMRVRWFASIYSQHEIVEEQPHLIKLQPSTIQLDPLQGCTFIPIFDDEKHIEDVLFEVCSEEGGSIDEEGNYLAPLHPGIYQIKATLEDQYVFAYIKVIKKEYEDS